MWTETTLKWPKMLLNYSSSHYASWSVQVETTCMKQLDLVASGISSIEETWHYETIFEKLFLYIEGTETSLGLSPPTATKGVIERNRQRPTLCVRRWLLATRDSVLLSVSLQACVKLWQCFIKIITPDYNIWSWCRRVHPKFRLREIRSSGISQDQRSIELRTYVWMCAIKK